MGIISSTQTLGSTPVLDEGSSSREASEPKYMVLENVRWETYEALMEDVAEQHVKITYDNGTMVFMVPPILPIHETNKKVIARMIELAAQVRNIPIEALGSTMWKRKDLLKGLEADECYYVQNEPFARGRTEIDLEGGDPPPDLAVEIDNTHHPLNRESIYAALGVGEIWHYDLSQLRFLLRQADGKYYAVSASQALPFITPADIQRYLDMANRLGQSEAIRAFHEWLTGLPRA